MPEHLRAHQFLPGQTGNPKGRPKKHRITEHLMQQLDSPIPDSLKEQIPEDMAYLFGPSPTFGQFAAFKLLAIAIQKGDIFAFKEILERVEGKVSQSVKHSGVVLLENLVLGEVSEDAE